MTISYSVILMLLVVLGGGKAQCITTYSNTAGIGKFFVDVIFEYEEDLDKAVPARI